MKKIIVITHYTLAKGYQETLAGLTGNDNIVTSICAYMNNEETPELKESIAKQLNTTDEFYLLTDLSFGSVNQIVSQFIADNIHVITGINLPFALELALAAKNNLPINLEQMIDEARKQLLQVEKISETDNQDDE
ncbi:hypothetical protein PT287_06850 [Lactobacillus sp. ESL0679]|uniref:PTS sugar transporter subunit IIA n=1 Tax=Lactobacillus sp. ESL0679 TaxID=2983209 RepID=UPI0023F89DB6|nr:hypothetical protein [Lactobacillus sp. ESL0679]MDF7683244.1 hypothetical protein [Lactobacillus sp. ESL0679]